MELGSDRRALLPNPVPEGGKRDVSDFFCLVSQAYLLSTPAWGQGGSCQVRVLFTLNDFPLHLGKLLPTSHCGTPWQSDPVPLVHFCPVPLDVIKLGCSRTEGHSEENSEKYKTGVFIATICGAPWSIFISDPVLAVQWGHQAGN